MATSAEQQAIWREERISALVLGHFCSGMRMLRTQCADYHCMPDIDSDGIIRGCDASNPVMIRFCPFCGIELLGEQDWLERMAETKRKKDDEDNW